MRFSSVRQQRPMFLGNDLVHWSGDAAREKATRTRTTRRFFDRVLHEREHPLLVRLGTTRSNLVAVALPRFKALWALWAAKEAAFKAAVKATPGLRFSPHSIRILVPRPNAGSAELWPLVHDGAGTLIARPLARGWARVRDQFFEILWEYHEEFVHALALGPWDRPWHSGTDVLTGRFWANVVHGMISAENKLLDMHLLPDGESTAVRQLAHQLFRSLGYSRCGSREPTIRRLRLPNGRIAPPAFYDEDSLLPLDLTMSHDGLWVAAGLLPAKTIGA